MVRIKGRTSKTSIKADVIILGCSLPGIVTAHKLKSKFGNTMNIVVLDLVAAHKTPKSRTNVAFRDYSIETDVSKVQIDYSARQVLDNIARYYLLKYAIALQIPIPDSILKPTLKRSLLPKVFQRENGTTLHCARDFHDFDYLTVLERFELNQYHNYLNECMQDLFQTKRGNLEDETKLLMYYDRTSMEVSICGSLMFNTSREIMRTMVRLVCGAPTNKLSLLFYLHQCYRTSSARNHVDGANTKFREKLLGYCRKRISVKLLQSIEDIILIANPISKIRTAAEEQVILESMKGETTYICSILAMALSPDQLHNIHVDNQLLSKESIEVLRNMIPGRAKKFQIQYEECFWQKLGYSGDIFSMCGPILWAMEKPKLSATGSVDKYYTLLGYLMVRDDGNHSKDDVVEQLVNIFGEEAADPVTYRETVVKDLFIPSCGDYVALRTLTTKGSPSLLEWGALDVFAEGDIAAALEAGHTAYLHLLSCLRPQAQSYEDVVTVEWPQFLGDFPIEKWKAQFNIVSGIWFSVYTVAFYLGIKLLNKILRHN